MYWLMLKLSKSLRRGENRKLRTIFVIRRSFLKSRKSIWVRFVGGGGDRACFTKPKPCWSSCIVLRGLVAERWAPSTRPHSPPEADMSAQGLLSSVFSCSQSPKTSSKRRLRHTRSLDPALMRHYEAEETSYKVRHLTGAVGPHSCLTGWCFIYDVQVEGNTTSHKVKGF